MRMVRSPKRIDFGYGPFSGQGRVTFPRGHNCVQCVSVAVNVIKGRWDWVVVAIQAIWRVNVMMDTVLLIRDVMFHARHRLRIRRAMMKRAIVLAWIIWHCVANKVKHRPINY